MGVEPGDPWEDEGYASEDDWGAESIAADIEEDRPLDVDTDTDTVAGPDEAERARDEKQDA